MSGVTAAVRAWLAPQCPFCQRVYSFIDVGKLRYVVVEQVDLQALHRGVAPKALADLTGPRPKVPTLQLEDGRSVMESTVILRYLGDRFPECNVMRKDPYERRCDRHSHTRHRTLVKLTPLSCSVENRLVELSSGFVRNGMQVLNTEDVTALPQVMRSFVDQCSTINDVLVRHVPHSAFVYEKFGFAECVYTPFWKKFDHFIRDSDVLASLDRTKVWRDACLAADPLTHKSGATGHGAAKVSTTLA